MAKNTHGEYTFSQVPRADIPRSKFKRSHAYKTTFNAGYLIPFYVDEALPGDTFHLDVSVFARLATPIVPIMDNLYLDTFFFFVPNRLLWKNWQRFMGEQDQPGDSTDYLTPVVDAPLEGFEEGSLPDYMGVPINKSGTKISALPLRAYNLIWNEWFRDENLQNKLTFLTDDGPDPSDTYPFPSRRGKRHDYFTSALPWPQKGEGVNLPLGSYAPITGLGVGGSGANAGPTNVAVHETGGSATYPETYIASDTVIRGVGDLAGGFLRPDVYADLSKAAGSTINSLREAFQMQKLLERDARGGTRYTEILRSHFGVTSPDARLQRPEYLGGNSQPIIINPVTQTSGTGTNSDTPQGNLAAYGLVASGGNGFTKSFVEHGVVIGLCMVRAELSYQQGINRMWSRRTRWDYYWPVLSHLGEQAILNNEIYHQGVNVVNPATGKPVDEDVFGYQERWAEYRYYPSLVTGAFRSNAAAPLDTWHLSQNFTTLPTLNATFIEENPPLERVIAVQNEPHIILDSWFNLVCARPMPLYSVPGLIDHF